MNMNDTYLGIELGSTRIKAVLIDKEHRLLASGGHTWENRFEDGKWTYSLDDIWNGIRDCYEKLKEDVNQKYDVTLERVGAIGVSAMMHGYMAFDEDENLLVPFRTWRNTITGEAAKKLTELFDFNIPQRWSIAHLYQSILNNEPHVSNIKYLTTLAGYLHWQLTGEKVLGIGDASGMFPLDDTTHSYNSVMIAQFDQQNAGLPWKLADILPRIAMAGERAGVLSEAGAMRLDPSGTLIAGIPMCPPEGDAGTGMVATNSVQQRTGNISAGTSVFAMIVLENALKKVHPEVDMVTTPAGDPVAMVHCNNCLGDLDAWVKLLGEAGKLLGAEFDINALYRKLLNEALCGDADCGGLLSYNYISGEHVTELEEGRPMFMRTTDSSFTLANFMRTHLYSSLSSLKMGMRILIEEEGAMIDSITGHGGFFKVTNVGLRIMATAMGVPVTVMATAGEGGPWGIAILAAYMMNKQSETLADYLSDSVFTDSERTTVAPDNADIEGFGVFMQRYEAGLAIERKAVETI
jgi:sugar (pentulose or hexulose) kinase